MHTISEENYLKAIYALLPENGKGVSTNSIAERLDTKASSVTDMVKKLAEKGLLNYQKYQGTTLTHSGEMVALKIVRKHRLWEVFLVEKLEFKWDEVHEIAEQLEHIESDELINRLDEYLDFPEIDPHGDPIPDKEGKIGAVDSIELSKLNNNKEAVIVGVNDSSSSFLQYLEQIGLSLKSRIKVVDIFEYDNSKAIRLKDGKQITLSKQVTENLLVKELN